MVQLGDEKMREGAPSRARPDDDAWEGIPEIRSPKDYIDSLRGRELNVRLFGERVAEPVDHPMIRPSINALAATYQLASDDPELATAHSPLIDARVNRFLHVPTSSEDLVRKHKMQRRMGQITGTCFQRCAGLEQLPQHDSPPATGRDSSAAAERWVCSPAAVQGFKDRLARQLVEPVKLAKIQ